MSDTPETDEFEDRLIRHVGGYTVSRLIELCKKFERERNQLKGNRNE